MAFSFTRWPEAEAKWKQNLTSPTDPNAVSVSDSRNGLLGCDVCYAIYLNPTKILTVQGDSWWAVGANKTRIDPDGAGPIGGSSIIRNTVCTFEGTRFDTSVHKAFCGNTFSDPRPFFDDVVPTGWGRYPMAGVRVSGDQVLVVGMIHFANEYALAGEGGPAGTLPVGPFATMLIGDIDGTDPDTWKQVDIPLRFGRGPSGGVKGLPSGGGQGVSFHFGPGIWVENGYMICVVQGPWDQTGHWSICRFPLEEVQRHLMLNPQWLSPGGDWVYDLADDEGFIEQYRYRITPDDSQHEQGGAVYPLDNGQYIAACNPHQLFDTDPRVAASIRSDLKGKFPAWDRFYDPPMDTGGPGHVTFDYGAYIYPGDVSSWPGKAASDQLWLLSQNIASGNLIFGNMNEYFPLMGKVTGAPAGVLGTTGA